MRWNLKTQPNKTAVEHLAKALTINENLAKILVQRGITTFDEAKDFFRPSLANLHDPFLMKGMDKAVKRINLAIQNNEKILIYGDYDVDGTTAVSLVYSFLKSSYKNVATYIPDRYKEGYGISYQGIDFAKDNEFSLIIALDCGIKAIEKVAYANEQKIDFIICDHHTPGAQVPDAVAILNPKQKDCNYPYKELCGCGVGFKLIQALSEDKKIEELVPYLDLVAIATAADIVPITGENRVLTFHGLKVINTDVRNGIRAIIDQAKREIKTITDVVFTIAPRINAAGRIKHANYAVELLTEENLTIAKGIAQEIEEFNTYRKELDKGITVEALQQIQEHNEEHNFTTVVYNENWHKGVIGIVASRLIETYYKPTLVFTKSGDKLAASARSVKGFSVYDALEQCQEYIEQFGGHKYAAGLTILPENYQKFKNKFEEVVKNTITEEQRTPEISVDIPLDLEDITPKFYRILKQMAPFGPQNMRPVFVSKSLNDKDFARKIGKEQEHLKLNVYQKDKQHSFDAIGFGLADKIDQVKEPFDATFIIDENNWNGNTSLQLVLKDIK